MDRNASWRRGLVAAAVVLVAAGAGPAKAKPASSAGPDWVSLRFTAHVREGHVSFEGSVRFSGGEPEAIGLASGGKDSQGRASRFAELVRLGGGVGATVRVAGLTYSVTAVRSGPAEINFSGETTVVAGRPQGFLIFAPSGIVTITAHAAKSVGVRALHGTGAHFLRVGEGGAGVGGAGLVAGTTMATADLPTGIVGAFGLLCAVCYDDWISPSRRHHVGVHDVAEEGGFAGRSGRWSWTWAGLAAGEGPLFGPDDPVSPDGVVGAYAPVPDWQQYADSRD